MKCFKIQKCDKGESIEKKIHNKFVTYLLPIQMVF